MATKVRKCDARKLGLKRYFTGRPCPSGHIADRMVSNGCCIECIKQYNRTSPKYKQHRKIYDRTNAKKYYKKETRQAIFLKRNYNLTLQEYNYLLQNQNECCAICGIHQSQFKKKLSVDHDHKTGIIRGLLCKKCNTGLGNYNDNPKLLNRAIQYIVSHKSM